MLNTTKLCGIIAERGTSARKLAPLMGLNHQTLSSKIRKGVMSTAELEKLVFLLQIDDPWETLFGTNKKGNQGAT